MRVRYATVKNSKGVSTTFKAIPPGIDFGPGKFRPDYEGGNGSGKESSGVGSLLAFRTLGADFAEVGNEVGGPAVDIVFQNNLAHAGHGLSLLFFAHFQGLVDEAGQLVHVVGIDEQSVAKLLGSARETAQEQNAAIILAGGDKFLRYKIHAVVERSDQADRSRAIEPGDFLVRMVPLEQNDGFPAPGLKARVDAVGFDAHFLEKLAVAGNVGAAGSANLDKTEAPKIGGIIFEKAFDSAEALENPFGVINAIHTDTEKGRFDAKLFAESGALFTRRTMRVWRFPVQRSRHADGIRTDTGDAALAINFKAIPIGESFEGAIHGGEKIAAVRVNLKTDEIGTQ